MVEPGVYTATVDFGQANYYDHGVAKDVEDIEFSFEITKAEIESAKADKDVYDVETGTVAPHLHRLDQQGPQGPLRRHRPGYRRRDLPQGQGRTPRASRCTSGSRTPLPAPGPMSSSSRPATSAPPT